MDAIPRALDGEPLTREELARETARLAGDPGLAERLTRGFGDVFKPAAFEGEPCFAPSVGQTVRFTRPDRWLGSFQLPEPQAAMAQVVRSYPSAYGPTTHERFARWFGTSSAPQAERWLRALGDDVVVVEVDGNREWMLAADVEAAAAARPQRVVRLLPAFDHYVVAAPRDDEAVLPAAHRGEVYRQNAWFSPVIAVDGAMRGTWTFERGAALDVELSPFAPLTAAERRAAEAEAQRLGEFLGAAVPLRHTPSAAGSSPACAMTLSAPRSSSAR